MTKMRPVPTKSRRKQPIHAEAVIEVAGQTLRIPLSIELEIKVTVNASRD